MYEDGEHALGTGDDDGLGFDWDDLAADGENCESVVYRIKRQIGGQKQVVYVKIVGEGIIAQEWRNCLQTVLPPLGDITDMARSILA